MADDIACLPRGASRWTGRDGNGTVEAGRQPELLDPSMLVLRPERALVWLLSAASAVSMAVNCCVSCARESLRRWAHPSILSCRVFTWVSPPPSAALISPVP